MMKISNLPNNIPAISTINVASFVVGLEIPIDKPTILSDDAKSNIASVRVQFAVTVISKEPMI